jgi:hypothetical protein
MEEDSVHLPLMLHTVATWPWSSLPVMKGCVQVLEVWKNSGKELFLAVMKVVPTFEVLVASQM